MKDFLGQDLAVGDSVTYIRPNYRELVKGEVLRLTAHYVIIGVGCTELRQYPNSVIKLNTGFVGNVSDAYTMADIPVSGKNSIKCANGNLSVGDTVITTESGSTFYNKGDKGIVARIDPDGDPWIDFKHHNNPRVYGHGVWCCNPKNIQILGE